MKNEDLLQMAETKLRASLDPTKLQYPRKLALEESVAASLLVIARNSERPSDATE